MMKNEIIAAIVNRVMGAEEKKYSIWTIGITNDPERRKDEHDTGNKVKHWKDWKANSESDARTIEKYFLDKGMKGDTGGGTTPTYVYIF